MSTKYYGVKKVPPGKKRANMAEAQEAGQIRYWGLKRADPVLIYSEEAKEKKKKILSLQTAIVKLAGRVKKLTDSIPNGRTEADKTKIRTEIENIQTEIKTKKVELKSLQ